MASAYYISILANEKNLDLGFVILSLVATTVIVWFLTYLMNERIIKMNTEDITLRYEFERKVEGLWIEKYNPYIEKIGYGLIEIAYDIDSKTTYLKGAFMTPKAVHLQTGLPNQFIQIETRKVCFIFMMVNLSIADWMEMVTEK